MNFNEYQHVVKLGNTEVDGILDGEVYCFSKIDGCNVQVFHLEEYPPAIGCGSRRRFLGTAGKFEWRGLGQYVCAHKEFSEFFAKHPGLRLHGEWLVPHTIKDYEDTAWNQLYVFDVSEDAGSGTRYLHHNMYAPLLDEFGIQCIPPIAIVENGVPAAFNPLLEGNTYLMKEGHVGEGLVLKRYDYVNAYGRTVWAKIINPVFALTAKGYKGAVLVDSKCIESMIVGQFVTADMVEREYANLVAGHEGWSNKLIAALLGCVYHALVTEEIWHALKKFKAHQTIDFRTLQRLCIERTKQLKPEVF
jgi:hypothetical protein